CDLRSLPSLDCLGFCQRVPERREPFFAHDHRCDRICVLRNRLCDYRYPGMDASEQGTKRRSRESFKGTGAAEERGAFWCRSWHVFERAREFGEEPGKGGRNRG